MAHGSLIEAAKKGSGKARSWIRHMHDGLIESMENAGHWKATGRMDFLILISKFWPLGEGFRGFGPQIRLQHAEISPGTKSEVIWLKLKGFPGYQK